MFIIIYLSDSWNSSSPSFGPGDGVLSETQAKHLESEKVQIGADAAKNEKNVKKCTKFLQKIQKSISAVNHRGQKKMLGSLSLHLFTDTPVGSCFKAERL